MTASDSGSSPPGVSSVIDAEVTARNRASEQSDLSRRRFVSLRRRNDLNERAIKTRHTARLNRPPLSPLDSESLSVAIGGLPVATTVERPRTDDVIIVGIVNGRPPEAMLHSPQSVPVSGKDLGK